MSVANLYVVEGVGDRDSVSAKVRAFSAADALTQCQTHWNNCWPKLTAVSVQPFVEAAEPHLRTCGTDFRGCDPNCPKQHAETFTTGGWVRHRHRGDAYVLLCRARSGWLAVRADQADVLDESDSNGSIVASIYYFPESELGPW